MDQPSDEREEQRQRKIAVKRMRRYFAGNGFQLDEDTLLAVLDMCDGNVQEAQQFLEVGAEEQAFDATAYANSDGTPPDFERNPEDMTPLDIPQPETLAHRIKRAFVSPGSTFREHHTLQQEHPRAYSAVLHLLLQRRVDLHHGAKARALAAALARKDRAFVESVLDGRVNGLLGEDKGVADVFGLPELLRALKLLDAGRLARQLQAKIDAQLSCAAEKRRRLVAKLKAKQEEQRQTTDEEEEEDDDDDAEEGKKETEDGDDEDEKDEKEEDKAATPGTHKADEEVAAQGSAHHAPPARRRGRDRRYRYRGRGRGCGRGRGRGRSRYRGRRWRAAASTAHVPTTPEDMVPAVPSPYKGRVIRLRKMLDDVTTGADDVGGASLTGALARYVRRLLARVPASKLEFFALQLPPEPWRELADLVHVNPGKGMQLPWFMPRAFGEAPPDKSMVAACKQMTRENALATIREWRPPYSFLRVHMRPENLSEACKLQVAAYAPISTCLWWHHELYTPNLDTVLAERIQSGDLPTFSYGKLMERLLYLKQQHDKSPLIPLLLPLAEQQLRRLDVDIEAPVAVLGDASYSMDVAIRVSVIISSVVTALTEGELRFFNTESTRPARPPRTAADVLEVASTTRADRQTAPAAALAEFYRAERVVKSFVVVTDEKENVQHEGLYFHQLFYKYYTEVYPANVIFVSFLEPNQTGMMTRALTNLGITPIQFALDARLPDLTKLDSILGLMSMEAPAFSRRVEEQDEKKKAKKEEHKAEHKEEEKEEGEDVKVEGEDDGDKDE